jgi:hypothetical protein
MTDAGFGIDGLLTLGMLAVSWYLVGLTWIVQTVTYPAFARVSEESWHEYHRHHVAGITPVVAPLMILQLGIACARPWFTEGWLPWLSASGTVGTWLVTFLLAVPIHNRLLRQRDLTLVSRLCLVHGFRTALWTLIAGLMTWEMHLTSTP